MEHTMSNQSDDLADVKQAADALIEWYREHPDLALLLIAIDNEIEIVKVAEAMNDE